VIRLPQNVTDPFIVRAAILWRTGAYNTKQIARELHSDEATVWNHMDEIKAAVRRLA
jgi:DNA-binding CsgD family transcriptional regulator